MVTTRSLEDPSGANPPSQEMMVTMISLPDLATLSLLLMEAPVMILLPDKKIHQVLVTHSSSLKVEPATTPSKVVTRQARRHSKVATAMTTLQVVMLLFLKQIYRVMAEMTSSEEETMVRLKTSPVIGPQQTRLLS